MKTEKKSFLDKIKEIPKNQLLIGGLAGILLLVIAIPTGKNSSQEGQIQKKEEKIELSSEDSRSYGKELERKLEQILKKMEGVGKVEVMITLQDEGEHIVEKDISRNNQEISEEDGTIKRSTQENQYQEETVFSQGTGSEGQPFVAKERVPRVEGVLVVAEGGGNSKVVKNISDAVLALFPVEVHKIKVVKMN